MKQGLGRRRAHADPATAGAAADRGGRAKALADLTAVEPYDPGSPCEIQVEFKRTQPADQLRFHPGVERLYDRMIRVDAPHLVGGLEAVLLRDLTPSRC